MLPGKAGLVPYEVEHSYRIMKEKDGSEYVLAIVSVEINFMQIKIYAQVIWYGFLEKDLNQSLQGWDGAGSDEDLSDIIETGGCDLLGEIANLEPHVPE